MLSGPTQLVGNGPVGVIVYLITAGMVPVLVTVSLMVPVPFALSPVTVPLITDDAQVKVVPLTADVGVKVYGVAEQMLSRKSVFVTVGIGLITKV